jgi:two-component system, OmpR family, sensor histidine kinase KdpD
MELMTRRTRLKSARQTQLLKATEKIQNTLLDSIAQDLRTPLVSIQGALSYLQEDPLTLDEARRQSLIDNAAEEADRLNRFIRNLLDMARVDGEAFLLVVEPYDVEDLIGSALERVSHLSKDRNVNVSVPLSIPLVPIDGVLIVKALVNLLENAIKYSAPDTPIEVQARTVGPNLEIAVADRGIGIPSNDLSHVFDKFYRVPRTDGGIGTGLGLAICKRIVESHSGTVSAENRAGGGSIFRVSLPLVS